MHRLLIRKIFLLLFWTGLLCTQQVLGFAATQSMPVLRVVSFNIYNRPWERTDRLQSILKTLEALQPDVIALQEVAMGPLLPGDPVHLLATHLKMQSIQYWHETNWGFFKTGLALLSKFPISDSEYRDFKDHQLFDVKGYMSAQIQIPGGQNLQLVNLHMASTTNEQIKTSEFGEIETFIRNLASNGAVLVLGDFNTERSTPYFIKMKRNLFADSFYDHLGTNQNTSTWNMNYQDSCDKPGGEQIDHILVVPSSKNPTTQISLKNGRIVVPTLLPHPSDHCPLFTEIAVGFR